MRFRSKWKTLGFHIFFYLTCVLWIKNTFLLFIIIHFFECETRYVSFTTEIVDYVVDIFLLPQNINDGLYVSHVSFDNFPTHLIEHD